VALALALAGCGVAIQSRPISIPPSQVPYDLLSPAPPKVGGETTSSAVPVEIYLVGPDQNVQSVTRAIPKPTQILNVNAQLHAVLTQLVLGPTTPEAVSGISTAIPAQARVLDTAVANSPSGVVVTVNFNAAFGDVSGSAEILAGEQVVLTVAALIPGYTTGVLFELEGEPIEVPVPKANGALVPGPVTVLDYLPAGQGAPGVTP
jgi:spore germination protein GerM